MPKKWNIPVYSRPSEPSLNKLGDIVVTVVPGSEFSFVYLPANGASSIPFEPDIYDPDWGYGPYMHQTVIAEQRGWVKLPKRPFPTPVWIKLQGGLVQKELLGIEKGRVYKIEGMKNLTIVGINEKGILARPEQPADMWCKAGDPPPLMSVQPQLLEFNAIWDADQHLKLKIAYPRGC